MEMDEARLNVLVASQLMTKRIEENQKKGSPRDLQVSQLMAKLREQVHELENAVLDVQAEKIPQEVGLAVIAKKMADTQNYALFVADKVGALKVAEAMLG